MSIDYDVEDDGFDELHDFDTEPGPEITQEEHDDAVIEDTTHCELCSRTILCGDNDCLTSDDGWAICIQCAERAHKLYVQACRDAGEESATPFAWIVEVQGSLSKERVYFNEREAIEEFDAWLVPARLIPVFTAADTSKASPAEKGSGEQPA